MLRMRPRSSWMAAGLTAAVGAGLLSSTAAHAAIGTPDTTGLYAHAAQITVGGEADARGCSGTLIAAQWLLTSKSCFATTPGTEVPAGNPLRPAKAVVGTGTYSVTELVPRAERDVVLARLNRPVTDVTPAKVATAPAAVGTTLTAAGFGRTKTEWVPGKVHMAAFTTTSAAATTLAIEGAGQATDTICQGDSGGPVTNAAGEVVGLSSRSWLAGCLGANPAETRRTAEASRVDDLTDWVRGTTGQHLLKPGQTIESGTTLITDRLRLTMQTDGNLVIYHNSGGQGKGAALWDSNTYGNPGAYAVMQPDGNLVVYKKDGGDGKGGAVWHSNTHGNPGAYAHFQNDGNFVVYKKDGAEGKGGGIWSSETWMRPNQLPSDGRYPAGFWADSANKILVMSRDGRLYIWDKNQGKELWSSHVAGGDGSFLHMGRDGNLVAYRKNGGDGIGNSYWSTATMKNPGAYAHFQNDGNFVVYKKDGGEGKGGAIWASGTWH
ncbi:trypsin-like serine protease [Streptomyces xanthophaeus]